MVKWLKTNWLVAILLCIILFLLKDRLPGNFNSGRISVGSSRLDMSTKEIGISPDFFPQAPPSDATNRLVIQDTNLSLVVKEVATVIKQIESITSNLGGYLVNSYLSRPEGAASGNIVVRVPESKRPEALESFKKMSLKVVSESVSGTDVTDEYVDLESRLTILLTTKQKFEAILNRAESVTDLLSVQRELTTLQGQIDSLRGQQKYYQQSAKLSKISVYLSTDELSLPYAPSTEWRPLVVFKTAVRSLISTLRGFGNLLIWLTVYSVIFVPLVVVFLFLRRRFFHH